MLVAAYVAPASASAATDASWRCWRAVAIGDTAALMKELGEVVCAARCAGGSGMQRTGPGHPACCTTGADSLVALIHVGAFVHEACDDLRLPSACRNPNAAPAVAAAHCVSVCVTWHNTRLLNRCAVHVLAHAACCVPLTPRHQVSRCIKPPTLNLRRHKRMNSLLTRFFIAASRRRAAQTQAA